MSFAPPSFTRGTIVINTTLKSICHIQKTHIDNSQSSFSVNNLILSMIVSDDVFWDHESRVNLIALKQAMRLSLVPDPFE